MFYMLQLFDASDSDKRMIKSKEKQAEDYTPKFEVFVGQRPHLISTLIIIKRQPIQHFHLI